MCADKYWEKFVTDGKIESYLDYVNHIKSQESNNDTNAIYDRRTDNQGTKYW